MNIDEIKALTGKFKPTGGEYVTVEDNDILLARWAAKEFIRAQEALMTEKVAFSTHHCHGDGQETASKDRMLKAQKKWEEAQTGLMPFIRDGVLGKTEFAHLATEMELIDWCGVEDRPEEGDEVRRVEGANLWRQAAMDVKQARRLAEHLRNELWKHVRKEGDPEKPTKLLPWEEPQS